MLGVVLPQIHNNTTIRQHNSKLTQKSFINKVFHQYNSLSVQSLEHLLNESTSYIFSIYILID